jgi:hypothetical protein
MPALEQALRREGLNADVQALHSNTYKAEVALKRSKTRDYFKIIRVARDANEAKMKTPRRHESLLHYPGKGGDDKTLKPIADAYAVLSDPQRRRLYSFSDDEDD